MSKTRSTALLAVARIVALGLQFISVRLYIDWLGQEQYGTLLLVQVWITYSIFLDLGVALGVSRRMTDAVARKDQALTLKLLRFHTGYAIAFGLVTFGALLGYGAAFQAFGGAEGPPGSTLLWVMGGVAFLNCLIPVTETVLAAHDRFDLIAKWQVVGNILGSAAALSLAASSRTVESLAVGMLILSGLTLVFLARESSRFVPWRQGELPAREILREILLIGLRSYTHRAAVATGRTADRLVVGTLSTSQLTAYQVAGKLPEAVQDIANSMVRAMGPELMRTDAMNRGAMAGLVERNASLALGVGCSFVLLPTAFADSLLHLWLGSSMTGLGLVMILMGVYRAFDLVMATLATALYAQGRPHHLTGFSILNAVATAGLSLVAFRTAGLIGLGVLNVAICLALLFPTLWVVRRSVEGSSSLLRFGGKVLLAMGCTALLAYGLHVSVDRYLSSHAPALALLLAPALCLGWMATLCALKVCDVPTPVRRLLGKLRRS